MPTVRYAGEGELPGGGFGGLSNALLTCNSLAELRNLVPLPDEAQRVIDSAVVRVGLDRLVIVGDLLAAGLTYNLPDPLSTLEVYWEKAAKIGHAQRTMIPKTRGENQLADRTGLRIPIYATMDDFTLGIRTLRASQRAGAGLDTFQVEEATRRVNEAIEDAAINGAGLSVAGNSAPGIFNAPNANTYAYESGMAWDNVSKTGEDILVDVLAMIDKLQADRMFGPYNLYVPTTYGNKLNQDFKANSDKTILQRLQEIQVGGRNLVIRVADQLGADRTALIQMTSNVIDVIVGQQPIPLSWDTDGSGWERKFVVMAFIIPRVKDTYSSQSGICTGFTS